MAFVPPMVSASPPPMSPDDTAENISDSDCDEEFSVEDVYLAGLSDKLGSITFDAIQAPPLPSPSKSDSSGASFSPDLNGVGGDTDQGTTCPITNHDPGDVPYETEGSRSCDDQVSDAQPAVQARESVTGSDDHTNFSDPARDSDKDNFDGGFCDFDSAFPESGATSASQNWFAASEQVPSPNDAKDQDFGDFNFTPSALLPAGKEGDPVVDIFYKLDKTLCAVIDVEFKNNEDGCESNVKKETFESLEEMVKGGRIWSDVFDAGTTPAMRLAWKTSLSKDKLYKVLNVDPSIVVAAERNNPMPAFASGLALAGLLEPTALPTPSARSAVNTAQQRVCSVVPELETGDSADENSGESRADRSQLSCQARAIVDAFPLLDFMRSPILMCPIGNAKNKLT